MVKPPHQEYQPGVKSHKAGIFGSRPPTPGGSQAPAGAPEEGTPEEVRRWEEERP